MIRVASATRLLVLFILAFASIAAAEEASPGDKVYALFAEKCLHCHGGEKQESGLRLDQEKSLHKGGDWGEPAVVPGKPQESFLFRVLSGEEEDLVMPPEGKGEQLTAAELELVKTWIERGGEIPAAVVAAGNARDTHWSFQPLSHPEPPLVGVDDISPIDAFIQDKLKQNGLSPSQRADRRTLIRRLYLVMLGFPPSPAEVDEFVHDDSPDAWPKLVDDVLASPHYGERWARHWLDLIRFGETHGFETNRERPNAWRYRDWVIDAFNTDLPYDDFIKQQIAGDALDAPIATGFLVAGPHDIVKSPDINLTLMQRQDELTDLLNTTGTAFLGLTVGCARCHNHKFDPITQTDFYSMQAVFAGVEHGDRALPQTEKHTAEIARIDQEITQLRKELLPFLPQSPEGKVLRPAVNALHNIEEFDAVEAKVVRFTILATNASQPCLDELVLFAGSQQVGLQGQGGKARCSSSLPGYEIHKLEHINDGKFGNSHSWISNEAGAGWVEIELPTVAKIDRIEWGRDREGRYADRLATKYRIEITDAAGNKHEVASSEDRKPFGNAKPDEPEYDFDSHPPKEAAAGRELFATLQSLQQKRNELAAPPMAYAGTFKQPGVSHRLFRGDPMAKREEVSPNSIEFFGGLELTNATPEQQRRIAFANWIADPENPLTARVIVNRLWQFHFGTGIVDTPSDFGHNGTPPSHPELLDWLAGDLIANNWSLKHIHREILLSNTWQQSNRPQQQALQVDASNRLLWRFAPRRLEAEAIRDSILEASGVLDKRRGGPGFSAFEVELENVRHFHPKTSFGPEDWRRMIYMTKVRQEQDAVFGLFDCPDGNQVAPVRSRSTTPLQALNLLNSAFVQQQADIFAERLTEQGGPDTGSQIALAYQLCYGRAASADEVQAATEFIRTTSLKQFARAMLNSNEFLFVQ
ncbi:MAG: PSD1 and planctomycete cytochrome C domain-containing protein [Planctomycetaceae bacterium]